MRDSITHGSFPGAPNESRLSCDALKKNDSFPQSTRAASFKRLLGGGITESLLVESSSSDPGNARSEHPESHGGDKIEHWPEPTFPGLRPPTNDAEQHAQAL